LRYIFQFLADWAAVTGAGCAKAAAGARPIFALLTVDSSAFALRH